MVSLSLMARLLEAVRPDARLVLVGDPGQLASIEAGAVLGDSSARPRTRCACAPRPREQLSRVSAMDVGAPTPAAPRSATASSSSTASTASAAASPRLADAIRAGDADGDARRARPPAATP